MTDEDKKKKKKKRSETRLKKPSQKVPLNNPNRGSRVILQRPVSRDILTTK